MNYCSINIQNKRCFITRTKYEQFDLQMEGVKDNQILTHPVFHIMISVAHSIG
jgi:hypothetical protein